jgi:hypothetical protein
MLVPGLYSDQSLHDATGIRSQQREGGSVAGKAQSPKGASPSGLDAESVGRAERITGTATRDANLEPAQRAAINEYFSKRPQLQRDKVDFSIGIGAAVPRQAELRDIPEELSGVLPSYAHDQYLWVDRQIVIVEGQTRRIVAIISLSA